MTNFDDGVVFIGRNGGAAVGWTLPYNAFSGVIGDRDVNDVPPTRPLIAQSAITNGGKGIDGKGMTKTTIVGNTVDNYGAEGVLLFVASTAHRFRKPLEMRK